MLKHLAIAVLFACAACSDDPIGPDPTSSTSSSGGNGGALAQGGSSQGGGGNGGGNAQGLGYENGSRLRARVVHATDGASQFLGWQDSALSINCSFRPTASGDMRCVPDVVVESYFNANYFSDAACTVPVGEVAYPPPAYVRVDIGGQVSKVYKVGRAISTVYFINGGVCELFTAGVGANAITEEPLSSFVAGAESVD